MTDIVLREVDLVLLQRLRRIGRLRGWDLEEALLQVLDRGLRAMETGQLDIAVSDEAGVLEAAIVALEHIPDDPGFALIGRGDLAPPAAPEEPDQSVLVGLQPGSRG